MGLVQWSWDDAGGGMRSKHLFDTSRDGAPDQAAGLATRLRGRRPDPLMAAVLRVRIASDPKSFHALRPKLAQRHIDGARLAQRTSADALTRALRAARAAAVHQARNTTPLRQSGGAASA